MKAGHSKSKKRKIRLELKIEITSDVQAEAFVTLKFDILHEVTNQQTVQASVSCEYVFGIDQLGLPRTEQFVCCRPLKTIIVSNRAPSLTFLCTRSIARSLNSRRQFHHPPNCNHFASNRGRDSREAKKMLKTHARSARRRQIMAHRYEQCLQRDIRQTPVRRRQEVAAHHERPNAI